MSAADAIGKSIDPAECAALRGGSPEEKARYVDQVARRNVLHSLGTAVGAMYDVTTGECEFLVDDAVGMTSAKALQAVGNP